VKKLSSDAFDALIAASTHIAPRVKRELRFVTSVVGITDEQWEAAELLTITDRTGRRGVLLMQPYDDLYIVPFELKTGLMSSTGRAQAIICDFCRTWQVGTRSGSVTFAKDKRGAQSVSYLCCADLLCSQHVRNLTSASKTSRSQLREDLTIEQRVDRLKERLTRIVTELGLEPSLSLQ
jgi:hypothetical protein